MSKVWSFIHAKVRPEVSCGRGAVGFLLCEGDRVYPTDDFSEGKRWACHWDGCERNYSHPSALNKHLAIHLKRLLGDGVIEVAGLTSCSPSPAASPTKRLIGASREHSAPDVSSSSRSNDQESKNLHRECRPQAPGYGDESIARSLSPSGAILDEVPRQLDAEGSTSNSQHHAGLGVNFAPILPIPICSRRRHPLDIAPVPPIPLCYSRPDAQYLFR